MSLSAIIAFEGNCSYRVDVRTVASSFLKNFGNFLLSTDDFIGFESKKCVFWSSSVRLSSGSGLVVYTNLSQLYVHVYIFDT